MTTSLNLRTMEFAALSVLAIKSKLALSFEQIKEDLAPTVYDGYVSERQLESALVELDLRGFTTYAHGSYTITKAGLNEVLMSDTPEGDAANFNRTATRHGYELTRPVQLRDCARFEITYHQSPVLDTQRLGAAQDVVAAHLLVDRNNVGLYATNGRTYLIVANHPGLAAVTPHPGADALTPDSRQLILGAYLDGLPASWDLYDNTGARNGMVIGRSRSGSSEALRGLLRATTRRESIITWTIDPGGFTFGEQAEETDWYSHDSDEAAEMVRKALQVVRERNQLLAGRHSRGWTAPSRDLPLGILVIGDLDEYLMRAGRETADELTEIAKMGRKVGVSVVADAGSASLTTFQGRLPLAESMLSHNVLFLRTHMPVGPVGDNYDMLLRATKLPREFADRTTTAGVGYLPTSTIPLRTFKVT